MHRNAVYIVYFKLEKYETNGQIKACNVGTV